MFRLIFSPSIPLIFFGIILFVLGGLILAYPELLAYFVALFLLLQGGFFLLLGFYFWLTSGSRQRSQRRTGYYEIDIDE